MNTHRIEVHNIGGLYTGHYFLIWDTKQMHTVCDDEGNPVRFPSWEKATIAAYQARDAAEEGRFTNWRGVPQIREIAKFHEARSRAGKKAFAERRLREAMREAAE
jgi:hypothetical protein